MAKRRKALVSRQEEARIAAVAELEALVDLLNDPTLLDEGGNVNMGTAHSALELLHRAQQPILNLMMYACDAQAKERALAATAYRAVGAEEK